MGHNQLLLDREDRLVDFASERVTCISFLYCKLGHLSTPEMKIKVQRSTFYLKEQVICMEPSACADGSVDFYFVTRPVIVGRLEKWAVFLCFPLEDFFSLLVSSLCISSKQF